MSKEEIKKGTPFFSLPIIPASPPVFPAEAGIQKYLKEFYLDKTGFQLEPVPAQAGAGMTFFLY